MARAQCALTLAREPDDPVLLARVLTACGIVAGYLYDADAAAAYYAEAAGLARAIGDQWRLSQILAQQSNTAVMQGDPAAAHATAEEGCDVADAVGDRFGARLCHLSRGWALLMRGDLVDAVAQFQRCGGRLPSGAR